MSHATTIAKQILLGITLISGIFVAGQGISHAQAVAAKRTSVLPAYATKKPVSGKATPPKNTPPVPVSKIIRPIPKLPNPTK